MYITIKESFSYMAALIDLVRKCEMCSYTCLKRVQLCVKPAGFLVKNLNQFHKSDYGREHRAVETLEIELCDMLRKNVDSDNSDNVL